LGQVWPRLHVRSAQFDDGHQMEAILPAESALCHLRAIRGGLWRCLAVTHGHSGRFDLRRSSNRRGTTRMLRMGVATVRPCHAPLADPSLVAKHWSTEGAPD
jgi:hypothetical protein